MHAVQIGRARVHATGVDPLVAGQRISRLLGDGLRHPSNLPPAALLFIRRMDDPRPGTLSLAPNALFAPPLWKQSAGIALEGWVRNAARPIAGAIPTSAGAVLFADRSELLACFAQSWLSGDLASQWWWRSLSSNGRWLEHPATAWIESPESIPAALEHLTRSNLAVPFVRKLALPDAREVLGVLLRVFALEALAQTFDDLFSLVQARSKTPVVEIKPYEGTSTTIPSATPLPTKSQPASTTAHDPPWQAWIAESRTPNLSPEQAALLGVGLMLYRAPVVVRSFAFVEQVRAWAAARRYQMPPVPAVSRLPRSTPDLQVEAPRKTETAPRVSHIPIVEPQVSSLLDAPKSIENNKIQLRCTAQSDATEARPIMQQLSDSPSAVSSGEVTPPASSEETKPDYSQSTGLYEPPPSPSLNASLETSLGGIFYLLNLFLFLELYGDFTRPLEPSLPLAIWDLLALVGRALLPNPHDGDPMWSLLADLAGRDPHQPPDASLMDEVESAPLPPSTLPIDELDSDLPHWAGGWVSYMRARLRLALGLASEASSAELARLLLMHSARVYLTGTRLDVTFSLEAHPVAIRLAGLDRNPGWIPAAGRIIAFHYE